MLSPTAEFRPVEEVFRQEKVGHLCRARPATASPEAPLEQVMALLRGDSGGCVVLVRPCAPSNGEQGSAGVEPVGIFTERDYLDKVAGRQLAKSARAADFMTPSPRTLLSSQTLNEAIDLLTRGGYRHLPLVDARGQLIGVLSVHDIIRYLAEFFPIEVMNQPPAGGKAAARRDGE